MKKNTIQAALSLLFISLVICSPFFVFAQTNTSSPSQAGRSIINESSNPLTFLKGVVSGDNGPYVHSDDNTLPVILGLIINGALSLLGIIFIILVIISGYQWMTAGGNEETVKKAQKTITNSIIGLIVVVSSWALWNFILVHILKNL